MRRRTGYALKVAVVVGGLLLAGDARAQFSVISLAQDGGPANGSSSGASLSADARFVAFTFQATSLVTGDWNGSSDVFVRDRQTGTTTRGRVMSDGTEAAGASTLGQITPDGRFVVFASSAALVAADTNACPNPTPTTPTCSDIYVHDRQAPATTTQISVATGGTQTNGHSSGGSISADGRFVVFTSEATNLVPERHERSGGRVPARSPDGHDHARQPERRWQRDGEGRLRLTHHRKRGGDCLSRVCHPARGHRPVDLRSSDLRVSRHLSPGP